MTLPSPEEIWTRAEQLEAAGEQAALAAELRLGHALGWPGFLHGLALRLPRQLQESELIELSADPLPLPRLVAARAYALQGRVALAERTARAALALADDDAVLDPELLEELATLLREAGAPLRAEAPLSLVAPQAASR
ncbi:MAG: hypothetical protein H6740_00885 [Alphaproteobacteria bacterium]|nr:hypothetical protein [Alphaproteobacteria bacterium]